MRNIIALLCIVFSLAACQPSSEKKEVETADTLTYAYDSVRVFSKHIPKNDYGRVDTPKAVISYPSFQNDTLNQYIKRRVFDSFAQEEPATSYQDIANSFVKGYDDFVLTDKETHQAWYLMIKISVLKQSANYLALKYIHSDYVGGAHGNTMISFLNYDPKTNKEIKLDSLIQPGKMNTLVTRAESIFRKNEKLKPTESLEDKYFFEKGKFSLALSFHVSDKGLVFLYNPYEIKAYAAGYTELIIPFSAIKDIAKPNTILTTLK
jgi:hypothetical protein